ncbi:MAG: hypothetical protein KF901_25645 [Myxococcales bacterium]|nr:hypothetical protein [Myxococcales bacterium]
MKNLIFAFVAAMMVGASGCIVVTDTGILPYDSCVSVVDCDASSSVCQRIVADWPEATASNNICTRGCVDSLDCPITSSGYEGTCAAFGSSAFLCYETCVTGLDCDFGFDCGDIGGGFSVCLPR